MKGKNMEAKRFDKNKLEIDLITPFSQRELSKVLTFGSQRYGRYNWMQGMNWSRCIASLKRHLNAFESGKDFDDGEDGSGSLHIAHVLCNAMFLLEYYRIAPEFDDRRHSYLTSKRIGLDIDGVLADFGTSYRQYARERGHEVHEEQAHWNFPYSVSRETWQEVKKDKEFWVNLKPLCDPHLPFEPVAYVTARSIPIEWTEEWLVKCGFPPEPVVAVGCKGSGEHKSKVSVVKDLEIDVFVDDCVRHFIDLSSAGVCTYLMDQPYNRKLEVGFKRIRNLSDILTGENLHASNS